MCIRDRSRITQGFCTNDQYIFVGDTKFDAKFVPEIGSFFDAKFLPTLNPYLLYSRACLYFHLFLSRGYNIRHSICFIANHT